MPQRRAGTGSPPTAGLAAMSASRAADELRTGRLSGLEYAQALLARVRDVEPQVLAWTWLKPAQLLAQAEAADAGRGHAPGPLHGIPVGVKDIVDTADMPTENGTVLHQGRQPQLDAAVVKAVRAAGGLVMGKTVTTELATYAPGKTRNPHNLAHTPGGSSSGSAAAVAAGMVPLAIGTQTNGSVIRPASFCGVVGYKPTAGRIPRDGVLKQSPALDQVGVFARNVEDAGLLARCLSGQAAADRIMPASRPRFGFVRTPMWERLAPDAQAAFLALAGSLGGQLTDIELPAMSHGVLEWHRTLMEADIAASFEDEYERGRDKLSASLRSQIERGRSVTQAGYGQALERRAEVAEAFDRLFEDCDALLTPATLGTAPRGLESTGDPVMCTYWTFTGQPAISLPLLRGANGLPLGVQLVGPRGGDAGLLSVASWLARCTMPHATDPAG
jgi:Asp-tRNA(Asn)/Glu-tRNA(Gln) amidotransferase A subunit family amidase